MQEFDHIEALWAAHTVDVKISSEEMLKQAKKDVNSMRTKSILNIVGMLIALLVVACLWLFDFQSFTTNLGISILVLAIAVYTVILYYNYRIIAKTDVTANPTQFINQLKIYQLNGHKLFSKLYWFYVAALAVGMVLYLIEILPHLALWFQITFILLSFGWLIFCSTIVRKAVILKNRERIQSLIQKFERIRSQFEENNSN